MVKRCKKNIQLFYSRMFSNLLNAKLYDIFRLGTGNHAPLLAAPEIRK